MVQQIVLLHETSNSFLRFRFVTIRKKSSAVTLIPFNSTVPGTRFLDDLRASTSSTKGQISTL